MSETWTVKRLLEWTTDFLKKQGCDSPRLDAEILLAATLSCQRIELYTNFDSEPKEEQRTKYREYVKRRSVGEPVAYLTGQKEFFSLPLRVDRRVLIPRPETELLVNEAIDLIRRKRGSASAQSTWIHVCDVGTGSGAIAIALAKQVSNCRITAIDVSEDALELARENAARHGVADRIEFRQSDLFSCVEGIFEVIISNPPYISRLEYEQLDRGVRDFEPQGALLGGEKGTEIIERLISQAEKHLESGSPLLLEVSPMIALSVADLLQQRNWSAIQILKDNAHLQRMVIGRR